MTNTLTNQTRDEFGEQITAFCLEEKIDRKDTLLNGIINPIYDTFFRILGCIAGPMIFLSVTWGIYGIGDSATLGRVGKRLMLRN